MLLMRTKNILRTISVLCLSVAFMATYANDTTQRGALRPQSVRDIRLLQQGEFDNAAVGLVKEIARRQPVVIQKPVLSIQHESCNE